MGLKEDTTKVLMAIGEINTKEENDLTGPAEIHGKELKELTLLAPSKINNIIKLLEEFGYLDVRRYFGTNPYDFGYVKITPRGQIEFERLQEETSATQQEAQVNKTPENIPTIATPTIPVGSPFGFTTQDWESASLDREDGNRLIVVFGHQWESSYFDPELLRGNVKTMFEKALRDVAPQLANPSIQIDYRPLEGGYGGHLFNQIARDIIGSDIAVFDTSDLNPNVMIEMGVALTWGVRVLPIRNHNAPKPPSDISGQTWAEYEESASKWVDPDHDRKLQKMAELAARRKPVR